MFAPLPGVNSLSQPSAEGVVTCVKPHGWLFFVRVCCKCAWKGEALPLGVKDACLCWEWELLLPSGSVFWPGSSNDNYMLYWQRKVDNLLE